MTKVAAGSFSFPVVDSLTMSKTPIGLTIIALLAVAVMSLLPFNRTPAPGVAVSVVVEEALPPLQDSIDQAMKTERPANDNGAGSCFPIAVIDGRVAWLTCAHVVLERPTYVLLKNGDRMPILKSVSHPSRDVGIVWTAANPQTPIVPVPLASGTPAPGTEALHAGYPGDAPLWLSQGLLGGVDPDGDIWTSVPFYYGCSGGPVIVDGQAVGVAMAMAMHGIGPAIRVPITSITCIVPIASVRDWIEETLAAGANPK